MASDFRYKAFISYRHLDNDRKWARWLIEKLETYRVPSLLVHEGVPARIGRLFRDDDEIPASNDLSAQIHDALVASEFLIVVCSQDTPASHWVSREIETFQALGRGDHILALLIDGEPHESFPPSLLSSPVAKTLSDGTAFTEVQHIEPLAADIRLRTHEASSITERRAFLRLAATLIGCRYDDLAQRERQRRLKRQRLFAAIGSAALLLGTTGSLYWWDSNREKVSYFADLQFRRGVPHGVIPLDRNAIAHRAVRYELFRRHGHVFMARRVNAAGTLVGLPGDGIDGERWVAGNAAWVVKYDDGSSRVDSVDIFNQTGVKMRSETYDFSGNSQGVVKFSSTTAASMMPSDEGLSYLQRISNLSAPRRSAIAENALSFFSNGLIKTRLFKTPGGQPAADADGLAGRGYSYTAAGQISLIRYVDGDGNTTTDHNGVASQRRYYRGPGLLMRIDWLDKGGHVSKSIVQNFDSYGNLIEIASLAGNGKLAPNELGFAKVKFTLGPRGLPLKARYFNAANLPTKTISGFAGWDATYDAAGREISEVFRDTKNELTLTASGFAAIIESYDTNGDKTRQTYLGTDMKPTLSNAGYAGWRRRYDDHGLITAVKYIGIDSSPVRSRDGFASASFQYEERGFLKQAAFFGANGKPALNTQGFARIDLKYDDNGNVKELTWYGTDGNMIKTNAGYAGETIVSDPQGNAVEKTWLGIHHELVMRKDGYARWTCHYDPRGNCTEEEAHDLHDHLVDIDKGFARIERRFDGSGKLLSIAYFNARGARAIRK